MTKIRHQITHPIDALRLNLTIIEMNIPGTLEELALVGKQLASAKTHLALIEKLVIQEIAHGGGTEL